MKDPIFPFPPAMTCVLIPIKPTSQHNLQGGKKPAPYYEDTKDHLEGACMPSSSLKAKPSENPPSPPTSPAQAG